MKINSISSLKNNKVLNFQNKEKEKHIKLDNTTKNIAIGAGALATSVIAIAAIANKKKVTNSNDIINDTIITNKEKLKNLISNFSHDDFDANKNFKVNLHIHSTMSDGKMTPLEILNQANERAQHLANNEKFTFSVTDHDNIEGVKIIADEIKKNPEKYSKLNFIPGIEMSVKYHNTELHKKPVELDFLIYGFDTNNQSITEQINKRHSYLEKHTQEYFDELNSLFKTDLSVEKMQKSASDAHLKNLGSNGYLKALNEYTEDYCLTNKIDTKGQIKTIAQKHFGDKNYAFDSNIELLDAVKLSQDANALCSIAHPGKFNFNHAQLNCSGENLADDIISKFIKAGGDGLESNYMIYKSGNQNWWERINASIEKFNFTYLKTGGYDCHGKTISSKH